MSKYENILQKLSLNSGRTITSTILIIIVMIIFLIGIGIHIIPVFDSVFLAMGMQVIVLFSAVNSNILPHTTLENGVKFSIIPLILAIFSCAFIFMGYDGFELISKGDDIPKLIKVIIISLGLSGAEYIFSFIFTARYTIQLEELKNTTKIEVDKTTKLGITQPLPDTTKLIEPMNHIENIEHGGNINQELPKPKEEPIKVKKRPTIIRPEK